MRQIFASVPASAEPKLAIDPKILRPLSKKLLTLLAEDDMLSSELAEQNAPQLRALLGKDHPALTQLLANFDFPAALALLESALARHPELL
ncbi:MAG: hypothetical protein ACD_10C00371G0001 [uncultured bacterium]|nr:MAG: hypothetical protein ACD_10C00371G0001 [uncultured bacterium]